jgi:hypothetical protein
MWLESLGVGARYVARPLLLPASGSRPATLETCSALRALLGQGGRCTRDVPARFGAV